MNLEKFSSDAMKIVEESQSLAIKNANVEISDIHLHKALIDNDNIIIKILNIVTIFFIVTSFLILVLGRVLNKYFI